MKVSQLVFNMPPLPKQPQTKDELLQYSKNLEFWFVGFSKEMQGFLIRLNKALDTLAAP